MDSDEKVRLGALNGVADRDEGSDDDSEGDDLCDASFGSFGLWGRK